MNPSVSAVHHAAAYWSPSPAGGLTLLTGERLHADFLETVPRVPALLLDARSGRVAAVGHDAMARKTEAAAHHHFERGVLVPGLVDSHVHLALAGSGDFGEVVTTQTEDALLRGSIERAQFALRAGVTVIHDQGGPGSLTLKTRSVARTEPNRFPDVRVSGRPITPRRGHMWYFGGEADGPEQISMLATSMVADGVDSIKVVASGGGTSGSNEFAPSYSADELRAAVDIAHGSGRPAMAHASCSVAIRRAVDAGCDVIHHCNFYRPDGVRTFDAALADRLAAAGIAVDPTLWVSQALIEAIKPRASEGEPEARRELDRVQRHWDGKRTDVQGLIRAGVRLIAGSDAGWRYTGFGDVWREIAALVDFGLPVREALAAATCRAAEVLGIEQDAGRLTEGHWADVVVLPADPLEDITAFAHPVAVYRLGRSVGV